MYISMCHFHYINILPFVIALIRIDAMSSSVWIIGPQFMELLGRLGYMALLDKVWHWKTLRSQKPPAIPRVYALSPC